ncbi:Phytosulfokine receptor 1 [Hibiscus syriacus]|uniref:non-specific serine/threonine protein kinase n=1 Tax=Hibiscus syriacus TaxID=106335 RepID=A0A6A3C725_HIBSY|nr:Phytosulfokine receptor 1 [Hibiscus syriacus]
MPNLEQLDLSYNEFSGQIPESINLPSIQFLEISSNSLDGSLPSHICVNSTRIRRHLSASKFEHFGASNNNFDGKLSPGIANLSKLVRLDVSSNNFSGEIPDAFSQLQDFQYLVAHSNHFSGGIPSSLLNSPTISLLNLRNNSMEGPIVLNCSTMVALNSLDLGTNKFSGPVPDNLPLCRQLENINLAKNKLGGQVPESFREFHSLSYLSLSNSSIRNLSSALRILNQCRNLTTLVLTLNFPDETLPDDPDLHFEKLKVLVIANCRLKGSFPEWLRNSAALQLLDLSWNHLAGTIPSWIGSFRDLFYIDLSNNSFTGEIPKSLTELPSLIYRDISLENPSPDFVFFMKRNESARGLQYNQIWSFPPTLDFGLNFLSGPIWPEFGNLKKLHVFDLKLNNFSGPIPENLSGMTSLEILDLSHNDLSGTIPPSLQSLSFLSIFNVAYNQLTERSLPEVNFRRFQVRALKGTIFVVSTGPTVKMVLLEKILMSPREDQGGTTEVSLLEWSIPRERTLTRMIRIQKKPVQGKWSSSKIMETCRELSIDDLLKSTNNFDQANIIGCGGFGLVYRGILPDGRKVAIKRLSGDCGQMDREFHAEVEALSRARHPNLVHLQGYCIHKTDRLLIYSFMENSSLDYWLHEKVDGPSSLDWEMRLQIAQGAARGLAYLHQSCEPHILHRDIKSSNILLDENFKAHLADFGLARLILPYDTHVTTDLVGTLGYIPPEYGQASVATYKGDVYSFGVVLLELLTGKRPMDMCKPKGCRDLISWVIHMKMEHKESEVFDPFIYDKLHEKEMLQVLDIACICLSESPKVRPTTQQLVSWLDKVEIGI